MRLRGQRQRELPLVSHPAPDYLRELPGRVARNLGASVAEVADVTVATLLHGTPALAHVADFENHIGIVATAQIRMHCMVGAEIVASWRWSESVCEAFRHHHDHFDGGGTPLGSKGTAILLAARIMAVTHTFEVLRRRAPEDQRGLEESLMVLKQGSGTRFDPEVVGELLAILRADAARTYTIARR